MGDAYSGIVSRKRDGVYYMARLVHADMLEEEARREHRILSHARREGVKAARRERVHAQESWGRSMDRLWRLATDKTSGEDS